MMVTAVLVKKIFEIQEANYLHFFLFQTHLTILVALTQAMCLIIWISIHV